jgi:hypothetical protein
MLLGRGVTSLRDLRAVEQRSRGTSGASKAPRADGSVVSGRDDLTVVVPTAGMETMMTGKEVNMPTDPEYHTILPEYGPREANVFHNHNDCLVGKEIKEEHRTYGRGAGRRLCDVCASMV